MIGSPPRTWGIPIFGMSKGETGRFTPTHVGNTIAANGSATRATVHPHARGEYYLPGMCCVPPVGSPPRTWGIRIPGGPGRPPPPVHPHARGEYVPRAPTRRPASGSPPRTWGIRLDGRPLIGRVRFTPTHVGNTILRVRFITRPPGSPPRTWGIRHISQSAKTRARFTPTHVGNTPCRRPETAARSVHPHARGEYFEGGFSIVSMYGSPPRTWGIPPPQHAARPGGRFTPTHVGNTLENHAEFGRLRPAALRFFLR